MKAQKWNCKIKKYYDYDLPEGACLYSDDMDKIAACARCGRRMLFGEGYTPRQIHICDGPGYAICGKCYGKEWQEGEKMIKTDGVIYRIKTLKEYNWLMKELDEAGCVWLYGNSLVDYDEHWAYIVISRSCIGVVDCTIALPKMPLKDNEIYKECEIIDVSEIMESGEQAND